jgi:hypothetical protein
MKNKITYLSILLIFPICIDAMEIELQSRHRASSCPVKRSQIKRELILKKTLYRGTFHPYFPLEIDEEIVGLTVTCAKTSPEAGQQCKIFACTNKFLNSCINAQNTLQWIKDFSRSLEKPNSWVAKEFGTTEAENRFVLQRALLADWDKGAEIWDDLNLLKKKGVCLDFSYDANFPTPLLQLICCHATFKQDEVSRWFIENGADVNACTPDGVSVFMYLCKRYRTYPPRLRDLVIKHRNFNVHYQDSRKNTALHYLVRCGIDNATFRDFFYNEIKLLLGKGANPTLKNIDGKTPLHLANKRRTYSLITLMENAVTDWNAKNDIY